MRSALLVGGLVACAGPMGDSSDDAARTADVAKAAGASARWAVPQWVSTAQSDDDFVAVARRAEPSVDAWTMLHMRHGRGGHYAMLTPVRAGFPSLDEWLVVATDRHHVVHTVHAAMDQPRLPRSPHAQAPVASSLADAMARAMAAAPGTRATPLVAKTGWLRQTTLVHRISWGTTSPDAAWQVDIDATSGAVVEVQNRIVAATGEGLVFDMNPVAASDDTSLRDDNDAAGALFEPLLVQVALPALDGSGFLRGAFADVVPLAESARAMEPTLRFAYDRADDRFEEVMLYYHLNRARTRLETLGFANVVARPQRAIANALAADQSYYNPATQRLHLGAGGVDDGEDADVILHEYGHAIQDDQVPGWGESANARAMGEGFSDYLAASFGETLTADAGRPNPADPACVADWDAVSYSSTMPPCLRRVDERKHYPEAAVDEPHADGEFWSAALWRARAQLGADVVDALVLESHFLLSPAATFEDGSQALLQADQLLFAGAHQDVLRRALLATGMTRLLSEAAALPYVGISRDVAVFNATQDGAYAANADDKQVIHYPGAAAIRVHFAWIDTEETFACGGACDSIYLENRAGDLFAIYGGQRNDTWSVQVPGNTAVVRLRSDAAGNRRGYMIDRYEVMTTTPPREPPDTTLDDDSDGGCRSTFATGWLVGMLLAWASRRTRRLRTA